VTLPLTIGLCPDHGEELYMPDPEQGDKCPSCTCELVIYERQPIEPPDYGCGC
jgi:hypothetical protein